MLRPPSLRAHRHRFAHGVDSARATFAAGGHASGLEHIEVIGRSQGEADVLLDQQDRQVTALGQLGDDALDLGDDVGLDALGRLVEDQDARLGQECPRNRQLLALAARQQPGSASQQVLECRERTEHLVNG